MRAVRCADATVTVVDVPDPTGSGVKVRVASSGVCGSDLHFVDQFPLPVTLGHEFAGFLDDGTAVAVEPLDPCWTCRPCLAGDDQLCTRGPAITLGIGRDGGMADVCVVPESAIVALPTGLEARDACLVEPLAVAVHGVRRGGVSADRDQRVDEASYAGRGGRRDRRHARDVLGRTAGARVRGVRQGGESGARHAVQPGRIGP